MSGPIGLSNFLVCLGQKPQDLFVVGNAVLTAGGQQVNATGYTNLDIALMQVLRARAVATRDELGSLVYRHDRFPEDGGRYRPVLTNGGGLLNIALEGRTLEQFRVERDDSVIYVDQEALRRAAESGFSDADPRRTWLGLVRATKCAAPGARLRDVQDTLKELVKNGAIVNGSTYFGIPTYELAK